MRRVGPFTFFLSGARNDTQRLCHPVRGWGGGRGAKDFEGFNFFFFFFIILFVKNLWVSPMTLRGFFFLKKQKTKTKTNQVS